MIAAVGVPELVKGSWIKPGAVVIDVGMNRLADKRLVGDAADSPIVKRFGSENQFGFGLTAAYSFSTGQ